jgi:glycosyltransferase involved in cell wall biosynthesis
MEKIKIITIITQLELGGAQKVALYTADGLGEEFESYFVSGEQGLLDSAKHNIFKNIKQFFNIPAMKRELNPIKDLIAFFKLFFLFKKIKPQIIHTHSSKAGILGRWAGFFAGVPVIVHTYHGFGFHDYQNILTKKFYVIIERLSCLISHKLIVVSNHNISKALKEKVGNINQYSVIRCGIGIQKYRYRNQEIVDKKKLETNVPMDKKIIGMIACFKEQKAPLDFIEIANEILKKRQDVFFVMIGDGELRIEIEQKIQKFGIQNNIKLLGWRDDVIHVIKMFDISVLTSLWEGLPMVLLESMASGIPVVATRVDGTQEIIKNDYNGFLVECHDVENFVTKIMLLLDNEELREKFIKNSNNLLVDEFDKAVVIEKIKNLYLTTLRK